jgi:hypothetical protein
MQERNFVAVKWGRQNENEKWILFFAGDITVILNNTFKGSPR